jgi:N-acetyl-anhydromuramyl-L-alanine amidase AmpD
VNVWNALMGILKNRWIGVGTSITRTGWKKWNVEPSGFKPTWIVIHHSLSPDGQTRDWDAIRKYHMSFRYQGDIITEQTYEEYKNAGKTAGLERPWKDIAYHIGIEEVAGVLAVQKGRPIGAIGAHALGFNDCSIGVCVVGNFDKEAPTESRLFLLGSVCRDLQSLYGIVWDHVIGHRETFTIRGVPVEKSCPGAQFDLVKFRERLI